MKRLALVLLSALALAACQDPSSSSPTATEQPSAATGSAAFRLGSAELAALSSSSDSLRVEAWRDGCSTSVSGSLASGVQIDGLTPGAWAFRVAVYDKSGSMRWYGEASTLVVAGRTVDLTVTLRAATGSVRVGIVLDSGDVDTTKIGPVSDTLWPEVDSVLRSSDIPMPFLGAWRSGAYVAIRVVYNCNATKLKLVRTVDDSGQVHLRVVNAGPFTEAACAAAYSELILMYKYRSVTERIKVEDHLGNFIVVPASIITIPQHTRFTEFAFTQGGGYPIRLTGGTADNGFMHLSLSASGRYMAIRGRTFCDSTNKCTSFNDTVIGALSSAALDSARGLFADTAVYGSVPLTPSLPICADAPWWKASVTYIGDKVTFFDKPEEICSGLPESYERVSIFAGNLINRAFPK